MLRSIPLPTPTDSPDTFVDSARRLAWPNVGPWSFWFAHAAFWAAAFGGLMVIALGFGSTAAPPAWFLGVRVAFGFVYTALLRGVSKRLALLERFGISKIGLAVGGPLVGAAIMTIAIPRMEAAISPSIGIPIESVAGGVAAASPRLGLSARFLLNFTMLSAWCVAYFGLRLLRDQQSTELRALEAEGLAYRNELHHLQSQISPHFLFNALNTIVASKDDPEAIEAITHSLAKYLRFLLAPCGPLEPLGREIDAIEQYLTIQSFRFGDRLICRVDCDTDVRKVPVLPVMIQPLVENSLKYGAKDGDEKLEVTIKAWRRGDRLFIEVANTGSWVTHTATDSAGTGIKNLRRRLSLHAGPDASVTAREEDGWVRSTITIPLERKYAASSEAVPAGQRPTEAVR